MQLETKELENIYNHFGDDISKEIFKNRLLYSITKDTKWICNNLCFVPGGSAFLERIKYCVANKKMVIFGIGVWGKDFYQITSQCPWKCFVDNYSDLTEFQGLPVVRWKDFLEEYCEETIFISSRIYHKEIYRQLKEAGITDDHIVNVGKMLDELSKRQYFDLEELKPEEESEIFLDVGGYDGMTTLLFNKWSNSKNSFSYIFEPDKKNREKCYQNLESHHIRYKLIEKGVWSEVTSLRFQTAANGSSSVSDAGEDRILLTTIDKELGKEKVTFIKMDIEGAELQALKGAEHVISEHVPKLAISVYHKAEDIWEIPKILLKYNPSYRFFLRHYSLTDYETVLYALPTDNKVG